MAMRWYVVHVYSGSEKKVAQSIEEQVRQAGFEDMVEEVLVPTEEVVEMRRGAKHNSERKFFPGYVLVQMEMDDETWHLVKEVPKVLGFIGGVLSGFIGSGGAFFMTPGMMNLGVNGVVAVARLGRGTRRLPAGLARRPIHRRPTRPICRQRPQVAGRATRGIAAATKVR